MPGKLQSVRFLSNSGVNDNQTMLPNYPEVGVIVTEKHVNDFEALWKLVSVISTVTLIIVNVLYKGPVYLYSALLKCAFCWFEFEEFWALIDMLRYIRHRHAFILDRLQ